MTYFEVSIEVYRRTCRVSIEEKYFPTLGKYHCILRCQSWVCCCSCSQTLWGSMEPVAVQVFGCFKSFMVRF